MRLTGKSNYSGNWPQLKAIFLGGCHTLEKKNWLETGASKRTVAEIAKNSKILQKTRASKHTLMCLLLSLYCSTANLMHSLKYKIQNENEAAMQTHSHSVCRESCTVYTENGHFRQLLTPFSPSNSLFAIFLQCKSKRMHTHLLQRV